MNIIVIIRIDKVKPDSVKFTLFTGGDLLKIGNLLRRIIISDIPNIAIDTVIIDQNTSYLADEYIYHRISWIPLVTDNDIEDMDELEMCIDRVNDKGQIMSVTSNDLMPLDRNVRPIDSNIFITHLFPGQSLKVRGTVKRGYGRENAKWSVVTIVEFKPIPETQSIVFKLESIGAIEAERILKKALEILQRKMSNLHIIIKST